MIRMTPIPAADEPLFSRSGKILTFVGFVDERVKRDFEKT